MSPAKILAVDDEADFELLIRQRFRRQIRAEEFAFRFAHHGEEALALMAEEPDIELLLLDITIRKTLHDIARVREIDRQRAAAERARLNLSRYFSPNLVEMLAERDE